MHTSGEHTRDGLARIVGCSLFFLSRFHIQAFATLVVHRVLSLVWALGNGEANNDGMQKRKGRKQYATQKIGSSQ
jgi:hypothetical protein